MVYDGVHNPAVRLSDTSADSYCCANADTSAVSPAYPRADAYAHSYAAAGVNGYAYSHTYSHAYAYPNPDSGSKCRVHQ